MAVKEKLHTVFNFLNSLMIFTAISTAGLGIFIWLTEIPEIIYSKEVIFKSQGLISGILGATVSLLAWIGFHGVNNEIRKCMNAYIAIFGALAPPTMALGLSQLALLPKWVMAADEGVTKYMEEYYERPSSANITDALQLGYKCCGMFKLPSSYSSGRKLPPSCCDPLKFKVTDLSKYCSDEQDKFEKTCNGVLTEHISASVDWVGTNTILLSLFFIALVVIMSFIRRLTPINSPSVTTMPGKKVEDSKGSKFPAIKDSTISEESKDTKHSSRGEETKPTGKDPTFGKEVKSPATAVAPR